MTVGMDHMPARRADIHAHILVVDDDTRIRTLLSKYLREQGLRVSAAADAREARGLMERLQFDLIVLDVMMPGETGVHLTRDLRRSSDIPVLLLTARTGAEDRIAGLEAGADDYLTKPFEPRELLLRIGTILRRAQPGASAGNHVRIGMCIFHLDTDELNRNGTRIPLTALESSLLRLFAANPGMVFSRQVLSEHTNVAAERSVDVQITRLRRKLEPDPRDPLYLQTVRGQGYVLRLPDGVHAP